MKSSRGHPHQLSLWPSVWSEGSRCAPNLLLRAALFAALGDAPRRFVDRVELATNANSKLIYTGVQLDQGDLDLWLNMLHIARLQPMGNQVRFTDTPVSERWRDLLLAEHLALEVLHDHDVSAARSAVLDHGAQRFLEVGRFDREGPLGRRALFSVQALDAEFAGTAGNWPQAVRALAREGIVEHGAVSQTEVLWAFGTLIANGDMHSGNLSFIAEHGRPYQIAPAYDMTCMSFAPTAGGDMPVRELPLNINNEVTASAWQRALPMAVDFLERLRSDAGLSTGFAPCLETLSHRIELASERIARLAT